MIKKVAQRLEEGVSPLGRHQGPAHVEQGGVPEGLIEEHKDLGEVAIPYARYGVRLPAW